jgi:predicted lipid-binding transport protein (Tim44 family)
MRSDRKEAPLSSDSDNQDQWFTYTRTAGRITAAPANWKGWAVLLGGIAAIIALGMGAMRLMRDLHPLLQVAGLSLVIVAGVVLIVRVALAKGRPSS